jgi:hypothetical protein
VQERELHETEKRKLAAQIKSLQDELSSKTQKINDIEVGRGRERERRERERERRERERES